MRQTGKREPDPNIILVVEDDSGLTELITRLLGENGWAAAQAQTGGEALAWMKSRRPGLVLLDYSLPDMTGAQFVERAGAGLPFIVTTGAGDERIAVDMMKRGARDYLIKDSHFLDALPVVIRRVLEQIDTQRKLAVSEHRFERVFAESHIGMTVRDIQGQLIELNPAFCRLLGYTREELIGRRLAELTYPDDLPATQAVFHRLLTGEIRSCQAEGRLVRKDGGIIWVLRTVTAVYRPDGRLHQLVGLTQDITERKQVEQERETTIEFLRRMNSVSGTRDLVEAAVTFFKERSGCEAVGIRLRDGDDYPYYEARGFPAEFITAENSLCQRDGAGEIVRDRVGHPALACMCGNVICGRFDPTKPFFTLSGSFWTNSTTQLLACTSEADRQARTRNRCNGQGYESVALIPLCSGGKRLGLLQLNDGHKDRFSPASIAVWERLAGYLAVALAKARSEEALRESESRFRSLFESSLDAVLLTIPDGQIVAANPAACAMFDRSEEEICCLGRQVLADPKDPRHAAALAERQRTGRVAKTELDFVRRDGQRFPAELDSVILPGEPPRAFVIIRDITERKRTEESRLRLVTAVEQAAEAVVITDPAGTIQYVNPAFEHITGYSREEAVGRNPRLLRSGRHDAEFYQGLWETITAGEVWTGRFTNRRKDGTLYQEEATISPVIDKSGQISNFVAVKRDVSREQALEDQLRQAQKLEAIGQLASGIAHDFNNLLTALLGYVDVARTSLPQGHPAGEALDGIGKVADQAFGITKALRTFSGRSTATIEPLCLNLVVAETGKLLRHMLPRAIALEINIPKAASLWVEGDRAQLQQILMNLAINARDAMPDGGALTISLAPSADEAEESKEGQADSGEVQICVRDTGCGMPPAVQARIFEPFFTTKPRGQGTGLGLAIVHGIVRDHGGRVEVRSAPGKGSTFTVSLPMTEACNPAPGPESPATAARRAHGELVLLAEDDRFVRSLLTAGLQEAGYTVVAADDGDAAWRHYQERRGALSLLILDFDLPQRTGGECLRLIRLSGDNTPAIVISGAEAAETITSQSNARLLRKPFGILQLIATVHQALGAESAGKMADVPAEPEGPEAAGSSGRGLL